MGRIGKAVAKRLMILGMEINYHNRKRLSKTLEKNIMPNIGLIWMICYHMLMY